MQIMTQLIVQISNVVARNIVKDIKTDGILKKMRINLAKSSDDTI